MVDRSDDLRPQNVQRIEVFTGAGRRRWDDALKAQIVAESLEPGAIVTHVARRHGCRPQQVHEWRRFAREGLLVLPRSTAVAPDKTLFVPLIAERPLSSAAAKACDDIVVELDSAIVRVRGCPDRDVLAQVFAALRRSRSC